MSVSAEDQAKRAGKVVTIFRDVMLAIPILGDLIGLFLVVGPMVGAILVRSNRRIVDILILLVMMAAFFCSLAFMQWGVWGFVLALVIRFAIANKGFSYFARRLA